MIRRSLHILFYLILGAAFLALVTAATLAVRLSAGPVSLSFLTPTIEGLLNNLSPPLRFRLGNTVLTWEGRERGIDLRVLDVRLHGPEDRRIARIPEMALSVSAGAIADGSFVPTDVEVFRLVLHLVRDSDGRISIVEPEAGNRSDAGTDETLLHHLMAPPDPARPLGRLERVSLIDAHIELIGDGATGSAPIADLRIAEAKLARDKHGAKLDANLQINAGESAAGLLLRTEYRAATDRLDANIGFRNLHPARLAMLAPTVEPIQSVDLPLSGRAAITLSGSGEVQTVSLDASSGAGRLRLTEALAQRLLGQPGLAQDLPVNSAALRAEFTAAPLAVQVDELAIAFANGAMVRLPPPVEHAMPLSRLGLRGRYDGDRAQIDALDVDLQGPKISVKATAESLPAEPKITAEAMLRDVPVDDLRRYWPPSAAKGAHAWCTQRLSQGRLAEAQVKISLAGTGGNFGVTSLGGFLTAEGVTVTYLPTLPPVLGVNGRAEFDHKQFAITLGSGESNGLSLTRGYVVINEFDSPVERISIDVDVDGSVRSVLDLLSRDPFRYPQKIGLDPAAAAGRALVRLKIGFPLLKELPLTRVDLAGTADLSEVAIQNIVAGHSASDGQLKLSFDGNGLTLGGRVALARIPGQLDWREEFSEKAKLRRSVRFAIDKGEIDAVRALLPKNIGPERYLQSGVFDGRTVWTVPRSGPQQLDLTVDLAGASAALPQLGWQKNAGTPATMQLQADLADERLRRISRLTLSGAGLTLRGSAGFGADGGVSQIDVERLAFQRSDASATATRGRDGWDITISGTALDLGALIAELDRGGAGTAADPGQRLALSADVGTVWLASDRRLDTVRASVLRQGDVWRAMQLDAWVDGGKRLEASVRPDGTKRALKIEADDAGATLRTLGIFSDMRGGQLKLDGTFDDSDAQKPLAGRLRVRDYRIVNAPLLARLLSVLALSGIIDMLTGEGIFFSTLDVPFSRIGEHLEIRDAKAYGNSLGLTASGKVMTDAETVYLQGTVVPFYLINAALGRVPVIGDLFSGGEKGSGLFAATYTISGAMNDPKVSVNPLSILGPGVFRRLFSIFDAAPPFETEPPPAGGN